MQQLRKPEDLLVLPSLPKEWGGLSEAMVYGSLSLSLGSFPQSGRTKDSFGQTQC